jgi:hypothetical protein
MISRGRSSRTAAPGQVGGVRACPWSGGTCPPLPMECRFAPYLPKNRPPDFPASSPSVPVLLVERRTSASMKSILPKENSHPGCSGIRASSLESAANTGTMSAFRDRQEAVPPLRPLRSGEIVTIFPSPNARLFEGSASLNHPPHRCHETPLRGQPAENRLRRPPRYRSDRPRASWSREATIGFWSRCLEASRCDCTFRRQIHVKFRQVTASFPGAGVSSPGTGMFGIIASVFLSRL